MNEEEVIRLDDVWKIFGDRSPEAMHAVKEEGLTKPEVLSSEAAQERPHRAGNPGTEQDGGVAARISVAKGHEPVQDELPDRPLSIGWWHWHRFPIGVGCRVRSSGVCARRWRPCG